MPIYPVKCIINGQPTFEVKLQDILSQLKIGGALKVIPPAEYISERQRAWYRGVCLKGLSEWNGDTVDEWDLRLKSLCNGNELLNKEVIYLGNGQTCTRLSISNVCKTKMTAFIENVLSLAIQEDWPVTPPDPELRK